VWFEKEKERKTMVMGIHITIFLLNSDFKNAVKLNLKRTNVKKIPKM